MANPEYVISQLGGVEATLKRTLADVFRYVLQNLRWGRPAHQVRTENQQVYYLTATTPAIANTEFSILHGLSSAPYLLLPVLDLQTEGAQLVPLVVSRVADASRVYLKSATASAPITIAVEAS